MKILFSFFMPAILLYVWDLSDIDDPLTKCDTPAVLARCIELARLAGSKRPE